MNTDKSVKKKTLMECRYCDWGCFKNNCIVIYNRTRKKVKSDCPYYKKWKKEFSSSVRRNINKKELSKEYEMCQIN